MMDLSHLSSKLTQDGEGIWRCPEQDLPISYPKGGYSRCFAVEEASFWFEHRNRVLIQILKQFPPAGPLFDIGGGNGYVCAALNQAGFPTVLVEPAEEAARNALSRGVDPVVVSSFESAEFREQVIPAAGLFDVLEHIEDDTGTLHRIERSLVLGGRLYITVPAFQLLWSGSDTNAGHYRRYRLDQIGAKFQQAGLQVEYATYLFSPLTLPVLLFRSIPSRLGFALQASPKRTRRDHLAGQRNMGRLLGSVLKAELAWVRRGKRIPLGSSCLLVGRSGG